MLNENGKFDQLTLNDALTLVLSDATDAGIEVPSGSVEEQIATWMSQVLVESDSALYALYVKMFNPTGTDIDLQNPGNPRLTATVATGFLEVDNSAGVSPVDITASSSFMAPNGNVYTNGSTAYTIPAGEIGYISVSSEEEGISQNLPADQTFSSSYDATITNPQPFVDGSDAETDSEYLSRLIYLRTNNTSDASTPAAIKELLDYYEAARIYVNNSAGNLTAPVPIPANGYVAVVLFPSGVNASALEINAAITILSNRFEFGNPLKTTSDLHHILSGTIYTGTFPQTYTAAVAQNVQITIAATISVSFSAGTASAEKSTLASAFATQFVQNLIDFYGGADGDFNLTFQESGSPAPDPVVSTPSVIAATGVVSKIGPVISIEQIRAFISDEANAQDTPNLNYISCESLSAELDPMESGESSWTLDIDAPAGGTISVIDFVQDDLFSDNTSWYDRYIFIDPAIVTVQVNEI